MADGRHLEKCKRPYLRNGSTDLHKIRYGDAFRPSKGYGQSQNFQLLKIKSKMADGRILEKFNQRSYLRNDLTDLHEIWHGGAN